MNETLQTILYFINAFAILAIVWGIFLLKNLIFKDVCRRDKDGNRLIANCVRPTTTDESLVGLEAKAAQMNPDGAVKSPSRTMNRPRLLISLFPLLRVKAWDGGRKHDR